MKNICLILVILISTVCVYGLSTYRIFATLDATNHTIDATMSIVWENERDATTSIRFLLIPNTLKKPNPYVSQLVQQMAYPGGFDPGFIEIEDVKNAKGEKLDFFFASAPIFGQKYSVDDTILLVKLPNPVPHNGRYEIRMKFKTRVPHAMGNGDMFHHNGVYIWRMGWYPVECTMEEPVMIKPHIWKVKFVLPKGYKVICGGIRIDDNEFMIPYPAISCPIVFTREHRTYRMDTFFNVGVNVHYLPGYETKARLIATYARETLESYTQDYGPLDLKEIHIVQGVTPGFHGMGADGVIILGDGAFTTLDTPFPGILAPSLHFLVAHELAHMWFGIGIPVNFNTDNFLSESLAQYASIRLIEKKYGHMNNILDFEIPDFMTGIVGLTLSSLAELAVWRTWNAQRDGIDAPVTTNVNEGFLNAHQIAWYQKGLLAMRSLEVALGEEKFNKLLGDYYRRFKHRLVKAENFERVLKDVGEDEAVEIYKLLFESTKRVDYSVNREGNTLKIDCSARPFPPVEVMLNFTDDSTTLFVLREATNMTIPDGLKRVDIDPFMKSVDTNRYNNHYPPLVVNKLQASEKSTETIEVSPLDCIIVYPVSIPIGEEIISGMAVEKFDSWRFVSGVQWRVTFKAGEMIPVTSEYSYVGLWYKLNSFLSMYFSLSSSIKETQDMQGYIELKLALPETLDVGMSAPTKSSRFYLQPYFFLSTATNEYIAGAVLTFNNLDFTSTYVEASFDYNLINSDWSWHTGLIQFLPSGPIKLWGYLMYARNRVPPLSPVPYLQGMYILENSISSFGKCEYVGKAVGINLSIPQERRTNWFNLFSVTAPTLSFELSQINLRTMITRQYYELTTFSVGFSSLLSMLGDMMSIPIGVKYFVTLIDGQTYTRGYIIGIDLADYISMIYSVR